MRCLCVCVRACACVCVPHRFHIVPVEHFPILDRMKHIQLVHTLRTLVELDAYVRRLPITGLVRQWSHRAAPTSAGSTDSRWKHSPRCLLPAKARRPVVRSAVDDHGGNLQVDLILALQLARLHVRERNARHFGFIVRWTCRLARALRLVFTAAWSRRCSPSFLWLGGPLWSGRRAHLRIFHAKPLVRHLNETTSYWKTVNLSRYRNTGTSILALFAGAYLSHFAKQARLSRLGATRRFEFNTDLLAVSDEWVTARGHKEKIDLLVCPW